MNEALLKVKEALTNGELAELLMGQNHYKFIDRWSETPTDVAKVFISGFNYFVIEGNDNQKTLEFELHVALKKLLDSAEGTWWVTSILYSYLFGFQEKALNFEIDIHALIEPINASLLRFKGALRGNKNWVGWQYEEGLLGETIYMVGKINEYLRSKGIKELMI